MLKPDFPEELSTSASHCGGAMIGIDWQWYHLPPVYRWSVDARGNNHWFKIVPRLSVQNKVQYLRTEMTNFTYANFLHDWFVRGVYRKESMFNSCEMKNWDEIVAYQVTKASET